MKTFKKISLSSGCGDLDLGFRGGFTFLNNAFGKNNFEIIWANDIDKKACKMDQNFFKHPIFFGDIRDLDSDVFLNSNSPLNADIVLGGFPCQDFSSRSPQSRVGMLIRSAKIMKPVIGIIALSVLTTSLALANDTSKNSDEIKWLKEGASTIHLIWTEWMENPKLTYTKITKKTLESLHGKWTGSYTEEGEEVVIDITLSPDGKWSSDAFRPNMKDGCFYLTDGMLLLFESKISEDAELVSALVLNDSKLRLLSADTESGFVELIKVEQGGTPQSTVVP